MSANLYWEPTKRKKHDIEVGAPSSFMNALEAAFGLRTPTLGERELLILRGMAAATDGEFRAAFQELIKAIEQYEEIEISAEY